MKALVTGADGLLGSNLVRELLAKDYEIRVFLHPASRSTTLDGLPVEKMSGDLTAAADVEAAVKGCESIFHVAASTAMWPPRDPKITAVNVGGTCNVLDSAERCGVKRLVHVGSASSIGYGTKENPGVEETPYKYADFGLAYFDSKLKAQKIVMQRVREGRIDAVVVNPTFMFGAYDSTPSSGKMIVKLASMKPPFYPPGGRCFAHAADVAKGMIGALEKGRAGECYILGNRNMNMKEIFEVIAKVVGVRAPKIEIPAALMLAAGAAGTVYGELTRKAPEINFEMARSSCVGAYYSAAKAVRELSMPQTPVETAVEDSWRWLVDNGYTDK
ncbi:MAG: NAD-dependent epimerase/dehydratase family protein [bacterium]